MSSMFCKVKVKSSTIIMFDDDNCSMAFLVFAPRSFANHRLLSVLDRPLNLDIPLVNCRRQTPSDLTIFV